MEWKAKFIENLKEVRSTISPQLFLYLETCTKREQILSALEAVLDQNYSEKLDWLYSTLKPVYTTEKYEECKIISQFPSMHTFLYEIKENEIIVHINETSLKEHLIRTITADALIQHKGFIETVEIINRIVNLPITFGEIKK